jgi:hypothetical protein
MEVTSTELANRIPDFDDLLKLTESVGELMVKKLMLEKDIKKLEAQTVVECMTNPTYAKDGKAPAMSLIEATWKYTGLNQEILPIREELAITIGELEKAKGRYDLCREMIDIFQAVTFSEKKNLTY